MEMWKDILGFEGLYQVSNLGNIRRLKRILETKRKDSTCYPVILKCKTSSDGYRDVMLSRSDAKSCYLRVHRLVATAFIPNPENKPLVNHKDVNKLNNNASNLEWCTSRENIIHAFKNNRMMKHGKQMQLKVEVKRNRIGFNVTEVMRENIKKLRDQGKLLREIKAVYNLSLPYISMIVNDTA